MDLMQEAKQFMEAKKEPTKYSKEEYRQAFRSYFNGLISGKGYYDVKSMWNQYVNDAEELTLIEMEYMGSTL